MDSSVDRRPARRAVQVLAAALAAKGVLVAVELPLSLALDWWAYEGWMSAADLLVGVAAVVGLAGTRRRVATAPTRRLLGFALGAAAVAAGAWLASFLVAQDVLFVSFSARTTLHTVGMVAFLAALVATARGLAELALGAGRTRGVLRWGETLIVGGGALLLVAAFGARTWGLVAPGDVLTAAGLACLAVGAFGVSRAAELRRHITEAFE